MPEELQRVNSMDLVWTTKDRTTRQLIKDGLHADRWTGVVNYESDGVRLDFTGAGGGLAFYVGDKLIYRCGGSTGAMDKEAAASRLGSNVRHAQ